MKRNTYTGWSHVSHYQGPEISASILGYQRTRHWKQSHFSAVHNPLTGYCRKNFEVVCRKMFDHWFARQSSYKTTNLTKLNWRFECFCEVGYITRKESQDHKRATRWYQGNWEQSEWSTLLWHIKESTTSEHSGYHASVCLWESCSQSMWTYGDFSAHITCHRINDETNPTEIG